MRYLSARDVEVVRTLSLLSRIKAKEESTHGLLLSRYEGNPANADAAFEFGIFHILKMSELAESEVLSKDIEFMASAMAALHSAAALQPEFWLARFFLCHMEWKNPVAFNEDCTYMSFQAERNLKVIEQDIRALISLQEAAEPQPYFIVTYVLLADLTYYQGDLDRARATVMEGVCRVPNAPVVYLSDFLVSPFRDFIVKLARSGELEQANWVESVAKRFFPNEKF